jgi:tetratricopeptide (TPR) repeat protein
MPATLNLVEHILAMGRRYQELGRHRDALEMFTRLCSFRELPAHAAEEAQVCLAELHLKRRRFARARRHLTAALRYQPNSARYHFLMATALHSDDRGDLERAAEHFRQALAQEPDHVRYLADSGLLLVRMGQNDEGLKRLRRAAELAPDQADVLAKLMKGLRLSGQSDEARSALRAALFRNSRNPHFRKLWSDFQIDALRRRQETARLQRRRGAAEGPVLLPFVRVVSDTPPADVHPTVVRSDGLSAAAARAARRSEQRNVQ